MGGKSISEVALNVAESTGRLRFVTASALEDEAALRFHGHGAPRALVAEALELAHMGRERAGVGEARRASRGSPTS